MEHLHLHTDFSLLDGFGTVEEYAKRIPEINQQYFCITDHGMMSAVPTQIRECEKHNIEPIFGCELYVNPLQRQFESDTERTAYRKDLSEEDQKAFGLGSHLLAIVISEEGYRNLVRLTSWGWLYGKYRGKPRVNHEQLIKYKEGIIFTSCCYNSEVGRAFDKFGAEAAEEKLCRYMDMFGENYLLEIMMLNFIKQPAYNEFIIKMHEKYHRDIILTQDCHYCHREHSHNQRLMLMIQTGRTLQDIKDAQLAGDTKDFFELQDENLWLKSEDELNFMWEDKYSNIIDYEVFKAAKRKTVEIARLAAGVKLDRSIKLPIVPDADEDLKEKVMQGFKWRGLPTHSRYLDRIKREYKLICNKEFSSYFLIQKMMIDEARRICPQLLGWGDGSEAVGPGRGSAVGSLICYCLGITDVDPIREDLIFERFLSEARGGKSMKLRFAAKPIQAMADQDHIEEMGYEGSNLPSESLPATKAYEETHNG
tara:strand:+ start:32835 stop:34274 length:1440 start_codon:yes stop_codon:yes gene_type:complete